MRGKKASYDERIEIFWDTLSAPTIDGCLEWLGHPRGAHRYGRCRWGIQAHRFAWELKHGPIRNGLFVLHRCDNRRCCNVDHLFLGTLKENAADMLLKGRANFQASPECLARGERSGQSTLTPDLVKAMRAEYIVHATSREQLAVKYGIRHTALHNICTYKTWKHIPPPARTRKGGRVDITKLPKGESGRALCRCCSKEVPQGRRSFCSDTCVHVWKLSTNPGYLREQTYRRDKGVCALCRVDTKEQDTRYRQRARGSGKYWAADHIIPVAEGGGQCGLENIRTLCTACHKQVTAELRKRLKKK